MMNNDRGRGATRAKKKSSVIRRKGMSQYLVDSVNDMSKRAGAGETMATEKAEMKKEMGYK